MYVVIHYYKQRLFRNILIKGLAKPKKCSVAFILLSILSLMIRGHPRGGFLFTCDGGGVRHSTILKNPKI